MESFAKFEHEGWQRVAGKYDSVWARSTRQFIPSLLDAAEVNLNMSVLDVGSGPGYVAAAAAERGAVSRGLDFSREMVAIAQKMFPRIEFCEGDAQNLPFTDVTFDRVLRLLPNKRSQPIPSRILSKLRLKQPVVGVSRYETRRFYSVTYHGKKGRTRVRTFSWRDPKGELAAYAAAIKFRRKKTKFR